MTILLLFFLVICLMITCGIGATVYFVNRNLDSDNAL